MCHAMASPSRSRSGASHTVAPLAAFFRAVTCFFDFSGTS